MNLFSSESSASSIFSRRAFLTGLGATALILVGCGQGSNAASATASAPAAPAGSGPLYTCSMHPQVRSTDPKGRCPICGMNLIPVAPGQGN